MRPYLVFIILFLLSFLFFVVYRMSASPANDNSSTGPNSVSDACSILTESENGELVSGIPSAPHVDQATVAEDPPEILGSVVQSQELENGDKNSSVQLRTSARVSKKMRLDVIANQTPPERKGIILLSIE